VAVKALRTQIRAVDYRDCGALLRLHRELWFDHDARGGMPASTDDEVWAAYGLILERQLSHRDGRRSPNGAFEGKLGHLVSEYEGRVVGQVEVYLDRFGYDPRTPHIAELRSLIVTQSARGLGLGAALVREAASSSRARAGANTLVSAEVLARNEALSFYDALGFRTLERLSAVSVAPAHDSTIRVEAARALDAHELTHLDHASRQRRQAWGDPRFDPPSATVSSDLVRLIADGIVLDEAQRGTEPGRIREELLARDARGRAWAAGYLVASPLGPPFAPVVRAEIARLAADPENPNAVEAADALVAEALARASALGATELLVRSPFLDPYGEHLAEQPGVRPFSWILAAPAATVLRRTTKP
jgi:ribosomal protein S18 acetylase RimI-like enzyme